MLTFHLPFSPFLVYLYLWAPSSNNLHAVQFESSVQVCTRSQCTSSSNRAKNKSQLKVLWPESASRSAHGRRTYFLDWQGVSCPSIHNTEVNEDAYMWKWGHVIRAGSLKFLQHHGPLPWLKGLEIKSFSRHGSHRNVRPQLDGNDMIFCSDFRQMKFIYY